MKKLLKIALVSVLGSQLSMLPSDLFNQNNNNSDQNNSQEEINSRK
jgi:hypothetical protein